MAFLILPYLPVDFRVYVVSDFGTHGMLQFGVNWAECSCSKSRREPILARRNALQVRPFVARRERYRRMGDSNENEGAGTPRAYLNSPPDLCH